MQLTVHTDYAFRVLIYLALKTDKPATISEIAEYYSVSRNHLMKVVQQLSQKAFVHAVRGKNGGLRLARPANEINAGDVARQCEPNFHVVGCFDAAIAPCTAGPVCALKPILAEALDGFFAVLSRHSIADLIKPGARWSPVKLSSNRAKNIQGVPKKEVTTRK